jgi:catechol 2,3-dioxygenase-like lactoylglutathione lyase family enzyme
MQDIVALVETGVYAADLVRAEEFYHDVLGLEVLGREAGRHVFFRVGRASVLLVFNPETTRKGDTLPTHGTTGAGHFALGIAAENLDAWPKRLAAHGVAIEKEVRWPRGGQSIYFRDPAGNSVELLTPGLWGLPAGW